MVNKLRHIPSVEAAVSNSSFAPLLERHSRERVVEAVRRVIDDCRRLILEGTETDISLPTIAKLTGEALEREDAPCLKRVVNATGTVIHTNLGRSILPECAAEAITLAARHPVNLEYDIESGKRGSRDDLVERLICRLTGAEAATVVNNNAAAVMITLNTLASRKEVIVSRGELVEIGGSFRIPDILRASGCRLVETGTTNKTKPADYRAAVTKKTGAFLKVHTSNYRIVGFTESVELDALAAIGKELSIPVVEDLGSGALIDLTSFGLPKEPVVSERIALGADLVTFSGDKLLGGPQAGIIAGRKELVKRINKNPLKRVLRVDKLILSALEAVLLLYLDREKLKDRLPTIHYLSRPLADIRKVAEEAAALLGMHFGNDAEIAIVDAAAEVGSGALPGTPLPSVALAISHKKFSPNRLARLFRENDPPILGRISDDRFLLDLRCIERAADLIPKP